MGCAPLRATARLLGADSGGALVSDPDSRAGPRPPAPSPFTHLITTTRSFKQQAMCQRAAQPLREAHVAVADSHSRFMRGYQCALATECGKRGPVAGDLVK